MKSLKENRNDINAIDEKLVRLLEQRMQLSTSIISEKIRQGNTVLDAKREEEIVLQLSAQSSLPLETIKKIWSAILEESKKNALK